jgi:uncharacterized membrane protein
MATAPRRPQSREEQDALWAADAHWSGWNTLYFCKEDERLLVPKRGLGLGWTLNLGRDAGAAILLGIVIVVPALTSLAVGTAAAAAARSTAGRT